jgi:uncharacterized protein YybS (DUF2232 family)
MRISDAFGCIGLAMVFLSASTWLPFFGPAIGLLTPLPILYYATKLGFYRGVILTTVPILVGGLILTVSGNQEILIAGMEYGILGLALSELFRKGFGMGRTIFITTALMLMMGIIILIFVGLLRNSGPIESFLDYFQINLNEAIRASQEAGFSQEKLRDPDAFQKSFLEIIPTIYPSIIIISTGFVVWLNIIMAKPLFRLKNLEYPNFMPGDLWRAPEGLVWAVIVSGFALFFVSGSIKSVAINVLIIMMVVYFFHGLSILLFYLNKYHAPSWLRIIFYFFILIQWYSWPVLAFAGLFDQWLDFRRIHRRTERSTS